MKLGIKRIVGLLLLATMLLGVAQVAVAASDVAGLFVDGLIPICDELLTDIIDSENCITSSASVTGKAGTIYINFDTNKVLFVGDTVYRTYYFLDADSHKLYTAAMCYVLDTADVMDLGVKIYWVSDGETKQVTEADLGKVGAQVATWLQ